MTETLSVVPTALHQQPSTAISDHTVLVLLWKVIERMRNRGDNMTVQCLLNEQKLIHLHLIAVGKKTVSEGQTKQGQTSSESNQVPYSFVNEAVNFVQKVNKVTMENFKDDNENVDIKIFSKAVDILMLPTISKMFTSEESKKTLGRLKVLTFNNLACIYKKKKKFGIALRSVSFALQVEEALMHSQSNEEKYDIIPTYLNKAAILSEMKKHDKAIEEILKSKKLIERIEKEVIKQISSAEENSDADLKKRLEEKRYYGLYMKMIIYYNMGAEKEHLKMIESACDFYKQGRQLAIIINNDYMLKQFDGILKKIMK